MAIKCPKCHFENPDTQRFCGECGTRLDLSRPFRGTGPTSDDISVSHTKTLETPVEELKRGTAFAGRYEIIEALGAGGMGKVYRVEDKKTGEELALKLIKPEISADKKTIERFSNEIKLAHKISHRNVCRMFHLGGEKGTCYITMEYVPGEDIKSFIRRSRKLTVETAISITKQVCEGLAEAHSLGVIHRDVKPSNIMIDKDGNARIMDFGIARSLKAKGITGAGVMIGTPEYMSPEQVEGKEADQRSDIYSLGVILYEMVTGRVPFEGDTPLSIAMKHKSEIPKDPRELNSQIPEDLNRVILRCMEKDKENRYQGAEELLSELEMIEKGIPTTDRVVPKRKSITSKEITVTFGLKKILIPASVVIALAVIAVLIWQLLPQKEAISLPPGKPSIAVLPFEDLSPQKDQEYFCDGMTEALINALTNIKDLRVVARTSAFSFKGKKQDVREIGKMLDVETVLEGSVQKAGNKLRITVQLTNVNDGFQLWSEQYNRDLVDVFAIQDEITLAIVDKLKVKLLGEEKEKLAKRPTENLKAYTLYLKGRLHWRKRTYEDLKKAIEYFELAIKEDPNYALAYTGIADSYSILSENGFISPKVGYSKAREKALKALELDNTLSETHTSLAMIKAFYDWDWEDAEREFKRAIELNPSYATAHQTYAWFLTALARHDEAIKEIKLAKELDPLSPRINANVGYIFIFARQYDHAIKELKQSIEMFPDHKSVYNYLGKVYLLKSMYEEALDQFQKTKSQLPIGITYAMKGKRDKALQMLDDLIRKSKLEYVSPCNLARICFALGENDQGFEWLDKAYQERGHEMYLLKTDPLLDSVRSDPRFKALLKKMNLD